jgi:hypothetical protein
MTWHLDGFYVENCSCDAICPCTWSNLSKPATFDYCRATLAFHIDRGDVDGTDVSGRTVVLAIETPQLMVEGNWKAGLVFDEAASDAQMDAITKVFTGALGGPMAGLAPLIGNFAGVERAPIQLTSDNGQWSLQVGDSTFNGSDIVGPDSSGPVVLQGITAHPAGPDIIVTPSGQMQSSLFGIEFAGTDRSGFRASFSWAA